MTQLTRESAQALQAAFEGRITSSHEAHTEFVTAPPVLVPESVEDVGRALQLARAANRRVFVRSGAVSTADIEAAASDAPGLVISMEVFRGVWVDGQRVTVGVAATTGDVATELIGRPVFLPLDDDPTRTLVSAVLRAEPTRFPRSAAGAPLLRTAVAAAVVVPVQGPGAGVARTLMAADLDELWAGTGGVVTELVLDTSAWAQDEADRWLRTWVAPYDSATFPTLCDALFAAPDVPAHVDLSVRVTSAAFGMRLVIVRVTGCGDGKDGDVVGNALTTAGAVVLSSDQARGPGSSVAAWVTTGPGEAMEAGEVHLRFDAAARPYVAFRDAFLDAVSFALGGPAPGVEAWAVLELAPDGRVVARAHLADARAEPAVSAEARQRMALAFPPLFPSPLAQPTAVPVGLDVLPEVAAVPSFDLASNRSGAAVIPGFLGDVLVKADGHRDYRGAIQQYAVSSYSAATQQARMSPRFIAEPVDGADVVAAVRFAAAQSMKVVARSGGHQYCGLSTGGEDTLLLDMKRLGKPPRITFSPDGTSVTVRPGVALRDLSPKLRNRRVVVPHGECPLVNLGGHIQTGGVGHQLRSLGVALDWVRGFKMVTRAPDGTFQELSFAPGDAVFGAVLGGGPGSWGVLTEITLEVCEDPKPDDVTSFGRSTTFLYDKEGFRAALEQLRLWADRQAAGTLPPGIDLFLSVVSGELGLFRPSFLLRPAALLVETMCTSEEGRSEIDVVVQAVKDAVSIGANVAGAVAGLLAHMVDGRAALSVIADAGVRSIGTFGLPKSGREFDLPYKKSLSVTLTPFTAAFRDAFVDLVHEVEQAHGLKVVVQAVVGGGRFLQNGASGTTRMQRRDALVQLVFDVFYDPGIAGTEDTAQDFQDRMKALLPEFSGGESLRMFWGTFEDREANGAQLDMRLPAVQAMYYDSAAEYQALQAVKAAIDPTDLFHTSFTVQLP